MVGAHQCSIRRLYPPLCTQFGQPADYKNPHLRGVLGSQPAFPPLQEHVFGQPFTVPLPGLGTSAGIDESGGCSIQRHLRGEPICGGIHLQSSATAALCHSTAPGAAPEAALVWAPARRDASERSPQFAMPDCTLSEVSLDQSLADLSCTIRLDNEACKSPSMFLRSSRWYVTMFGTAALTFGFKSSRKARGYHCLSQSNADPGASREGPPNCAFLWSCLPEECQCC